MFFTNMITYLVVTFFIHQDGFYQLGKIVTGYQYQYVSTTGGWIDLADHVNAKPPEWPLFDDGIQSTS